MINDDNLSQEELLEEDRLEEIIDNMESDS